LEHSLQHVVLRTDGMPVDAKGVTQFGRYFPEVDATVINLAAHVDEATDKVQGKQAACFTSFRALIWHNLMLTYLHEQFHSHLIMKKLAAGTPATEMAFTKEEDSLAEDFAVMAVLELAKTIDLEIPGLDEWPWFGGQISAIESGFPQKDAEWAALQALMWESGYVYFDADNGHEHKTMRDFLHMLAEDDDAAWLNKVDVTPELVAMTIVAEDDFELSAVERARDKAEAEAKAKAEALEKDIADAQAHRREQILVEARTGLGLEEDAEVSDDLLKAFLAGRNTTMDELMAEVEGMVRNPIQDPPDEAVTAPPPPSNAKMPDEVIQPDGEVVVPPPPATEAAAPPPPTGSPAPQPTDTTSAVYPPTDMPMAPAEGMGMSDGAADALMNAHAETPQSGAYSEPAPKFDHAGTQAAGNQQVEDFQAAEQKALMAKPKVNGHGLSPEQCWSCVTQVMLRLAQHVFTKCGFNPQHPKGWDSQMVYAVLEPVRIDDIPHATALFAFMDSRDHAGKTKQRLMPVIKTDQGTFVKGDVWDQNAKREPTYLPGYTFEIVGADGVLHKRTLLAQNPNTSSSTAGQAKNGWKIMHLMNGDKAFGDMSKFMGQVRLAPGSTQIEFIDKRR
jgi:hypothetical protein